MYKSLPYLGLSCKGLAAQTANERFVPRMDNGMHLQIVSRSELLPTQMTTVLLHAVVCSLVLRQILLAKERFTAFRTPERSRSHLVRFFVGFKRVFTREIFTAYLTNIRTNTQVRVDVFVEQIFTAVFSAARLAFPRFVLRIMHSFVDAE